MDHFQRIGVEWIPQPNPESVQSLAQAFQFAASDPPAKSSKPLTPAAETVTDAKETAAKEAADIAAPSHPAPSHPAQSHPAAMQTSGNSLELSGDTVTTGGYPGPSLTAEQRQQELAKWTEIVSVCTRCEILAKCRTQTVFGEGNVTPRVVFFGEGPGRDEDLSGRPFVGKAGQLLTKMIQACKFDRSDVYIMNTVKCRPPNNRNPEPSEVDNCREYFEAQLQLLRPEYIVCLGLVSAQALLKNKLSVGRMRGKFHRYFDSKVLVTYHPSYLLRTPAAKKAAWEDLQLMLRDAGLM